MPWILFTRNSAFTSVSAPVKRLHVCLPLLYHHVLVVSRDLGSRQQGRSLSSKILVRWPVGQGQTPLNLVKWASHSKMVRPSLIVRSLIWHEGLEFLKVMGSICCYKLEKKFYKIKRKWLYTFGCCIGCDSGVIWCRYTSGASHFNHNQHFDPNLIPTIGYLLSEIHLGYLYENNYAPWYSCPF